MIDDVRTTVLAVLNKNNYGYLSPMDFNLYAKQAQLEIFENLFYQYNNQINSENARRSGTDYADISKGILEDIDLFSESSTLTSNYGTHVLPNNYYYINRITISINNINVEVERVSQGKITALEISPLTAPSDEFPVYTQDGGVIKITPNSGQATARYIRYPSTPKWAIPQ